MSLNGIEFPEFILAEMYEHVLVEADNTSNHTGKGGGPGIVDLSPYLGQFNKRVLVLVHYPAEDYLPPQQLEFLLNIFRACRLTLEDIAIINMARDEAGIDKLLMKLEPLSMLLFGNGHLMDGLSGQSADFFLQEVNGINVMCAPPLEKLNQRNVEGKELKSALWQSLKRLYNV